MSYGRERLAITNFVMRQSYFGLSHFSWHLEDFTERENAGYMTIIPGESRLASIAGPRLLTRSAGLLAITFLLAGGAGTEIAAERADEIRQAFFEQRIDERGAAATSDSEIVLNFGADGAAPYISEIRNETPWLRTVVFAPFARWERNERRA